MKIKLSWEISMLNKLIGIVFKRNVYVSVNNLRNIQLLLENSDLSRYANKATMMRRFDFLKDALKAKLDERFDDEGIIINYCRPDVDDPIIEDIINNLPAYKKLNHSEVQAVHKFVEDRLKYGVIATMMQEMEEIMFNITNNEYRTFAEQHLRIMDWVTKYKLETRKIESRYQNNTLSLNDVNILERVHEIIDRVGSTDSILITGMRMFNEMLSPGFRPSRLYMVLGLTGGFKSALLLKIIIDTVRYNSTSYRPKKAGHKPVVLYLTMENTLDESFVRIFNMAVESEDIEKYTANYVVDKLKKLDIINNSDMELILAYRPNRSITTEDIRTMIDQLDEEGKEVVLLAFDYIKRIRPAEAASSEKEELKHVTDELRQIAVDYHIPVVTAHQMNRSGVATVNAAMRESKADLGKFLGSENVGTAWEVMENADFTLILNIERRSDGKLFLTFKRVKTRYKPQSNLDYFNQPFEEGNDFKLLDDIMLDEPLGVVSLSADLEGVDVDEMMNKRGRRTLDTSNYVDMTNNNALNQDRASMNLFNVEPINK